ncbi:hypothetical protein BC829DRAFT_422575 [Chytridium lagenaria]|nr:hypothetical protein BC829DRAFT_422575 [Chytridium lagenaria]
MEDPPNTFAWREEGIKWIGVGKRGCWMNSGGAVDVQVALFRIHTQNPLHEDMCPYKRAIVLSSSILGTTGGEGSTPKLSCPNHKKAFNMETGAPLTHPPLTRLPPLKSGSLETM